MYHIILLQDFLTIKIAKNLGSRFLSWLCGLVCVWVCCMGGSGMGAGVGGLRRGEVRRHYSRLNLNDLYYYLGVVLGQKTPPSFSPVK